MQTNKLLFTHITLNVLKEIIWVDFKKGGGFGVGGTNSLNLMAFYNIP